MLFWGEECYVSKLVDVGPLIGKINMFKRFSLNFHSLNNLLVFRIFYTQGYSVSSLMEKEDKLVKFLADRQTDDGSREIRNVNLNHE